MGKIFVSHSSSEKQFARNLAEDLKGLGHTVWLDEHALKVGDCIIDGIQEGLENADYVVVVLSPNALRSGWVAQEWKAKFWDEVTSGKTVVLPVLIADCRIPTFLKTKKFADFRTSYGVGLVQLANALNPMIQTEGDTTFTPDCGSSPAISGLLAKVQSRSDPLAGCIAAALPLAQDARDSEFETFCRSELAGWKIDRRHSSRISHREMQVFVSPFGEINTMYTGWNGDFSAALDYIRNDKEHFFPFTMIVTYPVAALEAEIPNHSAKSLLVVRVPKGSLLKNCEDPEKLVIAYARGDAYLHLLESIRRKITEYLLRLLPQAVLRPQPKGMKKTRGENGSTVNLTQTRPAGRKKQR